MSPPSRRLFVFEKWAPMNWARTHAFELASALQPGGKQGSCCTSQQHRMWLEAEAQEEGTHEPREQLSRHMWLGGRPCYLGDLWWGLRETIAKPNWQQNLRTASKQRGRKQMHEGNSQEAARVRERWRGLAGCYGGREDVAYEGTIATT